MNYEQAMNDISLEEQMVRAQEGDRQAYGAVLEEAARISRNYLRRKVNIDEDLEDIIQEILLSIHKARHTYDGKRPLKPWIFAIATYRFNDYLRRHYRVNARESVDFADIEHRLSQDVTEPAYDSELLRDTLNLLPEKQRKIVYMMKVEGYSAREVAEEVGMSVSAVKVAAHRAYKKLKEKLE